MDVVAKERPYPEASDNMERINGVASNRRLS